MKSLFYSIFLFSLLFSFEIIAQNTTEQNKRFFKLIDLKYKANEGFFQSEKQITKLLFEGAKNEKLPIYKVDYKENEEIEVERLKVEYMDRFQTLTTDQLSILGIDYVESTINSIKNTHIQYLHLFVAGKYFSNAEPQLVVSFRYEDAKRFLDNDHRSVWIPTQSKSDDDLANDSFFENLFLADEAEQSKISQKLAKLVKSGKITPYDLEEFEYKKKEKGKKKELKEVEKMSEEQFLSRWNSLTDAPIGEIRIQNIDTRIPTKDSHDFFTSKWITVWNTKSSYLKPVAAFLVEDIKPFFKNEQSNTIHQKITTYTKALRNQYFESKNIVWQNDDLKDEPFYKDTSPINTESLNQLTYYVRTEINLKENVNQLLFQNDNEISKLLLEAVEKEKLQAYQANYNSEKGSFYDREIDFMEVKSNLLKPRKEKSTAEILGISEEKVKIGISLEQVAELEKYKNNQANELLEVNELYTNPSSKFFYMFDISLLEIENELIYDIEKNRYYYQSAYVSLYVPAEKSGIEVNKLIAKFKIQDVLNILKTSPKMKLSEYQRQFIYQNYEAEKRIPKRVNYAYFLCKQLYIGNKWLVDGVFWE
ncbi:hypothetical protein Fleli_0525 [Bernardetia litoralis DSM 6794]|uniref:DUF3857 domain-containing protein n=1 Tax=Bernardetia litoralis (strain ATCC 23117 / DSM 6794 / NBRC 15988 / NCIMB 1366 / Fx l1 / Sio-4) TaxID=880071 RepID=I4AGB4_BERLS|nr:hypothetical protein [Bernardetia litoralis]AFM02999.1 hypothetical protein Fleli_0525 [Bernardetia litoralis DSM 6794]